MVGKRWILAKPSRLSATDVSDPQHKIVKTFGELFADGSAIEPVASDPDGHLGLLLWNKKVKGIARQVKSGDRIYQANDVNESILRAVRLPRNARDYGTAHRLFVETRTLFEQYHCCPAKVSGGPSNQLKISMITHG
jgi:hypothetical protein